MSLSQVVRQRWLTRLVQKFRSAHKPRRASRTHRRLGMETLEGRTLLAGIVNGDFQSDAVTHNGGAYVMIHNDASNIVHKSAYAKNATLVMTAVGDSLTAGFANGVLVEESQKESYTALLATSLHITFGMPLISGFGLSTIEGGMSNQRFDLVTGELLIQVNNWAFAICQFNPNWAMTWCGC